MRQSHRKKYRHHMPAKTDTSPQPPLCHPDQEQREVDASYSKLESDTATLEAMETRGLNLLTTGAATDEGINLLREVATRSPRNERFVYNLGRAFDQLGRKLEAAEAYASTIRLNPNHMPATANLANILKDGGHLSEAETLCLKGLAHSPSEAELRMVLAATLVSMGRIEEAVDNYRQVLEVKPRSATAHSNMLLTMNYLPSIPAEELFAEHRRWAANHMRSEMVKRPKTHAAKDTIRIGYVSPDFRQHSVAFFLEPILHFHNRSQFEIYCYSDVAVPDATTARMRSRADHWRDIAGLSDEQVATTVAKDRIDLLFDLAAHTGKRLGVFAMHPATVQVTYLGYPNTTGLDTVNYRLTDATADPPGEDAYHSECFLRMPDCFLCFAPPAEAPEPEAAPFKRNGYVTYGSFNNLPKINGEVIHAWAAILQQTSHSKLIIKCKSLKDKTVRDRMLTAFAYEGVARERIDIRGFDGTLAEHLQQYHQVDLALDSFPYNGTTTTCEALWMGVPVLTLTGERHRSRVGTSILSCLGLSSFAAKNVESYVRTAIQLGLDPRPLAQLRPVLRNLMAASPLCDGERFTRTLERLCLHMLADTDTQNGPPLLYDDRSHRSP